MTTLAGSPTRRMTAAQITYWQKRLKNWKDQDTIEARLFEALSKIPESTFQVHHMYDILLEVLRPYARHAALSITSEIADFVNRIWIANIYETGGIEAVNKELNRQLDGLKQAQGADNVTAAVVALNTILDAAIYLFPHEAYALEITLNPYALRDLERRKAYMDYAYPRGYTYGGELIEYRNSLRQLEKSFERVIYMPLTYYYTTQLMDTGQRKPSYHSANHFAFKTMERRITWAPSGIAEITLLWDPPVKQACLEAVEVDSIKFSNHRTFSPQIDMYWGERKLRQLPTVEENYLRFRGFRKTAPSSTELEKLTGNERSACEEMWTSRSEELLWKSDYESATVISAYIYDAREGEKTLYRVKHISFDEASETQLLVRILRGDQALESRTTRFAGKDIIEHLMTVPMHRIGDD